MNAAIVIGCSTYDDNQILSLKYADLDARAFLSTLTSTCGLSANEPILLTSDSPHARLVSTRNNIIRQLSQLPRGKIDKLFFFFSGHGFRLNDDDYLLPSDVVFNSLAESAIRLTSIFKLLQAWNPNALMLFLDACRVSVSSGKALDPLNAIRPGSLPLHLAATLSSCQPEERSFESDEYRSGIFTHALCNGLSEKGRCQSLGELDSFVIKTVPYLCEQAGFPIQNPRSRVEPAAILSTLLASDSVIQQWQKLTPIGEELRSAWPVDQRYSGRSTPDYAGFDFGTSYSAVAFADDNNDVVYIPSPQRRALVPSVVAFMPDWRYVVGWPAVEYSKTNPERTIFNVKRKLGTKFLYNVDGKTFTPERIASLIIRSLTRNFEEFIGRTITYAMISVPANFTMKQTDSLLKSFELARVPIRRLTDEPSAAALNGYTEMIPGTNGSELFFVVDLGGGTFDVSIVEIGDGVWEVKSASGDCELGGIDYDDAVYEHVMVDLRQKFEHAETIFGPTEIARIRAECERVKIELGLHELGSVILSNIELPDLGFTNVEVKISRAQFRAIVHELDLRIERCLERALSAANVVPKDISLVLLAGQGSKVFTVREIIDRYFPSIPIEGSYQEIAVVRGMGEYTAVFTGKLTNRLLLDNLPFGIGVRLSDSEFIPILVKNATIPTKNRESLPVAPLVGRNTFFIEVFAIRAGDVRTPETLGGVIDYPRIARIEWPATSGIQIEVDVDSNRTVNISVTDDVSKESRRYQLNNFVEGSEWFENRRCPEIEIDARIQE